MNKTLKKINIGGKLLFFNLSMYQSLVNYFGLNKSTIIFLAGINGLSLKSKIQKLPENFISIINNSLRINFIFSKILIKKYTFIIKREKQLGSYRGLRLKLGLPNRGQRTHSNAKTMKKRKVKLLV